ncbi:hypothetical protein [Prosthecomicrobium hirschii]|uniref:hypothetical protein n=1 Tax=Prosthecodimorpha hirschii TaxID=665126 RepID=UPI00221E9F16|nr:hypothetical protein [Prosthecomicrobium hirschii]MCW1844218.1 hypothetical protein [Prosthecomicrobium hirschii]
MFSPWLLRHRIARHSAALGRIALAKARILSILDREIVAHEKTLEQKIADQGPTDKRVDPHLISLAIDDMRELRRIAVHHHQKTNDTPWYANIGTSANLVQDKLNVIAPIYNTISNTLSNVIGDALEVVTFRALNATREVFPRYHFDGFFYLDRPKNRYGRFEQRKAPMELHGRVTNKQPDFLLHGHDAGTLCIECKNLREWLYPQKPLIKHHIIRCDELNAIPVLIYRRIHYSTITNFFLPAGIIAHESIHQYFPSDQLEIVMEAKNKRKLGFTDLLATEHPHPRTERFFIENLPRIVETMADKWRNNRRHLVDYANDRINLAQLYNAIGSKAGGNWVDRENDDPPEMWE